LAELLLQLNDNKETRLSGDEVFNQTVVIAATNRIEGRYHLKYAIDFSLSLTI
jgi:hypothetical protein